uniref:Syntaxin 12, like n=1 Tax=Sinocyclocheilus grahami TaxID=75366 RepID=A0A672RGG6_SINGR
MSYRMMDSSHSQPRDFNNLTQTCSSNIQKITLNTGQIKSMLFQLGTMPDTPELQDRLYTLKTMCFLLLPSCTKKQNIHSAHHKRLVRAKGLQYEQCGSGERYESGNVHSFFHLKRNEGWRMQAEEEPFTEEDLELIKERETNIRQLESDIMDVNQIFKDLAVMIHDQGDMIDSIEASVEGAEVHVERGAEQLQQAAYYQRKSRKRMCVLALILSLVATIFAIIVWQVVR